jgi:hypothetical protein
VGYQDRQTKNSHQTEKKIPQNKTPLLVAVPEYICPSLVMTRTFIFSKEKRRVRRRRRIKVLSSSKRMGEKKTPLVNLDNHP